MVHLGSPFEEFAWVISLSHSCVIESDPSSSHLRIPFVFNRSIAFLYCSLVVACIVGFAIINYRCCIVSFRIIDSLRIISVSSAIISLISSISLVRAIISFAISCSTIIMVSFDITIICVSFAISCTISSCLGLLFPPIISCFCESYSFASLYRSVESIL